MDPQQHKRNQLIAFMSMLNYVDKSKTSAKK